MGKNDEAGRLGLLREAREIVQRLVEIAFVLEKAGILHRDIKPAKVIRGEEEMLKLVDFGFARRIPTKVAEISACGSPAFCMDYSDEYQDVRCIGQIGFQMLLGDNFSEIQQIEQSKAATLKKNWGNSTAVLAFVKVLNKMIQPKTTTASKALELVNGLKAHF
jgi:serine/threonine protein kinase